MAVTYAWRLDADKYAYIVSPKGEDGYVSESPLASTDLNTVALTATQMFGENGTRGISGYNEAYKAMLEKISDKWDGLQYADILSADVYYNVDATDCADLRGVGVKAIRYLGACDANKWDPVNPSWNPSIEQYDCGNIQGKFSVYGIYMEDQEITSNATPENIFAVYNGANGENADGSASTATLEAKLNSEIKRSVDADEGHNQQLQALQKKVDDLDSLGSASGVQALSARVAALETENATLKGKISTLEGKIKELSDAIDAINDKNEGNTGSTGSGGASFGTYNGETVQLVGVDDSNILYKLPSATYSNTDGITASAFYQEGDE